jgi:nucleoside-diphosphate-sugar epimerase
MSIIEEDVLEVIKKIKLPDLKNKRILITGASGLVGVYLSQFFKSLKQELNLEIYCWIKNKVDPNFNNIFNGLNIIQSDITDLNSFKKIPYFDIIFHCSGYGQPVKFLEDEIKTIEINTLATNFLLKKLNKFGKFLFVSTSEIYSGIDVENITEEMIGTTNTDHFRSCYIEGKRCGESICYSYIKQGYDVKIARLCLAYGPGTKKDDGRVLNSIIQKSIINNKITLLDNGDAIRTYCYISDVIEMFINILFFGRENVYNVGGKSIVSIFELASLIAKKTKTYVEIPDNSTPLVGNPKIVNISIEKYQNEFNKHDFLNLSEGIDKTIKWQKNIYE